MSAADWGKVYSDRGRSPFVFLRANVVQVLGLHKQLVGTDREAAGVLVGRRTENGHIEVTGASEPVDSDRRSRFSVLRGVQSHQDFVHEEWSRSNGAVNYLGEWHTHPEPEPHPSLVDRMGWARCWFYYKQPSLLHAIQGQTILSIFLQTGPKKILLLDQLPKG